MPLGIDLWFVLSLAWDYKVKIPRWRVTWGGPSPTTWWTMNVKHNRLRHFCLLVRVADGSRGTNARSPLFPQQLIP